MNPSASEQPASANVEPVLSDAEIAATSETAAAVHPDPITGEPGAHPLGVGVGALGAGAAGAAIGALAGPIGVVVGAVIGAVAGGLAGKEVATTPAETALNSGDFSPVDEESPADEGTAAATEKFPSTAGEPGHAPVLSSSSTYEEPETSQAPLTATAAGLVAPSPSTEAESSNAATSSANPGWPDDDKAAYQLNSDTQPATPALAHSSFETEGVPVEETVRQTAYYRYLDRQQSGQPGDELEDWVEAEKKVVQH